MLARLTVENKPRLVWVIGTSSQKAAPIVKRLTSNQPIVYLYKGCLLPSILCPPANYSQLAIKAYALDLHTYFPQEMRRVMQQYKTKVFAQKLCRDQRLWIFKDYRPSSSSSYSSAQSRQIK